MVYNFYLDVAAIVLNLLLIVLACFRRHYPSQKVILYRAMLFIHMGAIIFDIVSAIAMANPSKFSLFENYLYDILFYIFHNMTAIFFAIYAISQEKHVNLFGEQKYWLILAIVEIIAIITTPYTKIIFSIGEDMTYKTSIGVYILYAIAFFTIVYVLRLKITSKEKRSTFEIMSNVIYAIALVFSFVFRLVHPQYLIELFAVDVAFIIMYVAQDSPEVFLYKGISVYNANAFNEKMRGLIRKNSKFNVLFFTPDDSEGYVNDKTALFIMEKYICRTIKETFNKIDNFYVVSRNCYALICEDEKETVEKINKAFAKQYEINNHVHTFNMSYGVFRHPGLVDNYSDTMTVIDDLIYMIGIRSSGQILEANTKSLITQDQEEIEKAIKHAIANKSVVVEYEPIFTVKTNYSLNAESKIKIPFKNGYLIYEEFMPVALKTGLIYEINEIVIMKICEFISKTKVYDLGIKNVAINIPLKRFLEKGFIEEIKEITNNNDIPCGNICFEITNMEGKFDKKILSRNIKEIKDLGFNIVMSGFGRNFIDYDSLANLPLNGIKINKELLFDALKNEKMMLIIESTVEMLKKLEIGTACSGVINKELADVIDHIDCDYVQGPYYNEILSEEEYINFLRTQLKEILYDVGTN